MNPERGRIPEWAKRERQSDLRWIRENLHVFIPAAKEGYEQVGHGALVVDTTVQPVPGAGHPFSYFPQAQINEHDDEDIKRLVREYNPPSELVIVMLKPEGRTSSYRVRTFRRS